MPQQLILQGRSVSQACTAKTQAATGVVLFWTVRPTRTFLLKFQMSLLAPLFTILFYAVIQEQRKTNSMTLSLQANYTD
jgi:hypothetical protein